jgi:glyoxylase-like metal-dependent hydrolase (beta-lactamase superfamily II)
VAFLDHESGDLYAGDVAGIHIPGAGFVLPPTPPPEFDPESWTASIELMRSLKPLRLVPTHFGPVSDPAARLSELETELAHFVEIGAASFAAGETQEQLTARLQTDTVSHAGPDRADLLTRLELASPAYMAAMGLSRYLTKRAQAAG